MLRVIVKKIMKFVVCEQLLIYKKKGGWEWFTMGIRQVLQIERSGRHFVFWAVICFLSFWKWF